jgi:hypothetical protein
MALKSKARDTDERTTLARVVHQLKQQHGPRVVAHWLYHQARTLTLEADRQAISQREHGSEQD